MLEQITRDQRVLILGTGSEMAETALALVSRGHRGRITALSPTGQLPPELPAETAGSLHEIVAWQRLVLRAGRVLSVRRLMKRGQLRALRVEFHSEETGRPAKLEVDVIL
jgi:uncharacterized NAD(P)/FAD-binding protein YdhS